MGGALSVLDVLIASGAMFLAQLAVLFFAPKEHFGTYSLLYSYILGGQMALSALFGAPLVTSASGLTPNERQSLLAKAVRWQAAMILLIGVAAAAITSWVFPNLDPSVKITALLAFVGLSLRELQRTSAIIDLKPERAMIGSALFALLTALLLVAIYLLNSRLTASHGFAALGIAAVIVAAGPLFRKHKHSTADGPSFKSTVLVHARWTLPGVVIIWIQNNLYLTIVAVLLTMSVVAEVSAARMVAIPYLIAAGGLLKINQVRFRRLVTDGRASETLSFCARWAGEHLVVCSGLAAAFAGAGALGVQQHLPHQFPHLLMLGALWFAFAGVSSARGVLSSLFQAKHDYRTVMLVNLTTLPTVAAGLFLLVPRLGPSGAIIPMIAAEAQFLAILGWLLWQRKQQSLSG